MNKFGTIIASLLFASSMQLNAQGTHNFVVQTNKMGASIPSTLYGLTITRKA